MPLSGWPASCLLPAHPTGVFPIRILCVKVCVWVLPSVAPRFGFTIFLPAPAVTPLGVRGSRRVDHLSSIATGHPTSR